MTTSTPSTATEGPLAPERPALLPTPSQTVGPYFAIGLSWLTRPDLVPPGSPGALRLTGRVLDAEGRPVPDAVLELWQADPEGRFPPGSAPGWTGFGRCPTDEEGRFAFTTVVPGPVGPGQAPHADLSVFARGLVQRLLTRVYFPGADPERDPVLAAVPPERRATLLAEPEGPSTLRFDVHLAGEDETVFFAW
jgi:protocatechuate 3,4-dioxygenase alpha subunit